MHQCGDGAVLVLFFCSPFFPLIQGLWKVSEYEEACCRQGNTIPEDVWECYCVLEMGHFIGMR